MTYQKTQLQNGMTILSERMESVRSITLGLWFNVGSRDEGSDQAGLAHFMEHMMFKGTPTKTALDISMHFDSLGAEVNAFTSKEYTCYYARFVDDKLEDALRVLSDMVINSSFAQAEIDNERQVVIEEIARSIDTPDDYVFELFTSSLLQGHCLGLPVLGTKERVGSYQHEDCLRFHNEHYHAGNLTLAAAGNIDHEALVALSERLFDSLPAGSKEERSLVEAQYHSGLFTAKRDIEQAHIVYGFPWHALGDERRYATSVLTTILGGSMSSRLFQEVREKRGLAYSIFATQAAHLGAGQWCVYAGTRPENISEVISLVRSELERIAHDAVSAEELKRTVDLICGQLLLGLESTNSHMVRLGKRETLGIAQTTPEEQERGYRSVTAQDILDLAQEYLTDEPTIAVVSPYDNSEIESRINV